MVGMRSRPPPTKWTISRRSPSDRLVLDQRSRGTMSRLRSMATRSAFMPSCSTREASVVTSVNSRSAPLMMSFIEVIVAGGTSTLQEGDFTTETRRHGGTETRRHGDTETRRHGEKLWQDAATDWRRLTRIEIRYFDPFRPV